MKIFHKKWKRRDLILLLERLELYISSGLTIDKALEILGQGISERQATSLAKVRANVVAGSPLSKSFATHLNLSRTLVGLIEHGESSGELARTIQTAKTLLEREEELSKKCLSALAYPVIIGIFSLILTIGLVRGVMPQIIPMLKSLHVQLPLLTRVVMFVSENLLSYGLYIFLGIITIFITTSFTYKKSSLFKGFCHNFLAHIPILGQLFYSYYLSLFLQSCGSLVESGLRIGYSYSNTTATVSFIPLSKLLNTQIVNIHRGIPLGSLMANKSNKIPRYISPLLLAGESSGTLGKSLIRVASILDRDIEHSLKRMTSLIEPVMMAGMGCVVGAIALSIMMPIYDISRVLQH
ncbi:MAG: type II secretion system F family protein [Patescibacteria group bacterium]